MKKQYGYIRVSARDQNPERQYVALEGLGIRRENIYLDKLSGKDFSRPAYRKMVKKLREGDILVIKSIDRLGRNYAEILEQWRMLTRLIKVDIHVIDMPLLNTDLFQENLTSIFISDLVLQILAYVAETERDFIRQRQAEGIAAAKANGVHFGRNKKELSEEFEVYYRLWQDGAVSMREAARQLNISHTTFGRRCREFLNEEILKENSEGCQREKQ